MKIKVLRVIARLNIGGPARNAILLSEGLSKFSERYENILVCGEVPKNEGDMGYLAGEKGVEPIIIKELGRELSIRNDLKAFWKLYRVICREKPHIIHTHTAKAGTLGRTAGFLYNLFTPRKAKLVHTFHGHVLHSYFGRIKSFIFLWIEKILALFTDRVITVSGSLRKELVERFRIAPESKFSVVELGFELDALLALPAAENRGRLNIGIIGRLVPIKNHKMLLRSACNMTRSIGDKIKFIIIGDGELKRELQSYVKKMALENTVEFKGWIKDLACIYKDLDIVVLTSLNEGTPVAIIEGMAAGRPVVASRIGGVSDIVEENRAGYLFKLDDDETFEERIRDLVNSPEKRIAFGKYGRESVRNRFSKDRLIKDMDRVYRDLVAER